MSDLVQLRRISPVCKCFSLVVRKAIVKLNHLPTPPHSSWSPVPLDLNAKCSRHPCCPFTSAVSAT
ncbi:MAG: hypothetical protein ACREBR_03455, partial [bacterium]